MTTMLVHNYSALSLCKQRVKGGKKRGDMAHKGPGRPRANWMSTANKDL